MATAGQPLRLHFDYQTGNFEFRVPSRPRHHAPTELYVPAFQYPMAAKCRSRMAATSLTPAAKHCSTITRRKKKRTSSTSAAKINRARMPSLVFVHICFMCRCSTQMHESLHNLGIEVFPALAADVIQRGLFAPRAAVRPFRKQCVPNIHYGENTCRKGYLFTLQPAWVTAAIPLFMVAVWDIDGGSQVS